MTEPNWDLLDRYLAGQCSESERLAAERWVGESPLHEELVTRLREAARMHATTPGALLGRRVAIWSRLEREIARAPAARLDLMPRRRRTLPLGIAAAVALAAAGTLAAHVWLRSPAARTQLATRTVRSPAGQRAVFQLPDGSQVILSPASTLSYPAEFAPARDVTLEGEAYFDVVHDERHPFTLRVGDLVARDLGTQFVARAYPEDAHARVVVRAGKVGLRAAASEPATRVVAPGEIGRLSAGDKLVVEPADTASWFAWTRGWLVFDGVPLRDAIPQLSRWYDLDFRLSDPALGDRRLVATLRNQPTADALDVLALALGLRQTRRGRVVTFSRELPQ